jgi:hypothetical protein
MVVDKFGSRAIMLYTKREGGREKVMAWALVAMTVGAPMID